MRVLHLTRDLPPHTTGGISNAVGGLVKALADRDTACAVISFDGWRPYRRKTIERPIGEESFAGAIVWRIRAPSPPGAPARRSPSWAAP